MKEWTEEETYQEQRTGYMAWQPEGCKYVMNVIQVGWEGVTETVWPRLFGSEPRGFTEIWSLFNHLKNN